MVQQHGQGGRGRRRWRRMAAALAVAIGCLAGLPSAPAQAVEMIRFDECGVQLRKPTDMVIGRSSQYWSCVVAEEFLGSALDPTIWDVQTTAASGFGVGGECFVNDPDNIAVSGGSLKLSARKEASSFTCASPKGAFTTPYTAGAIVTKPAYDRTYGKIQIRARMPNVNVPGVHFAFWMWPRNLANYPVQFGNGDYDLWTNGEIDILEWYSTYPQHQVPFLHYAHTYVQNSSGKWVPDDPNLTKACFVGAMSDWHTYTLEWSPSTLRILFDGTVCLENKRWTPRNTSMPGPFDKPFMTSLVQALGATGTANQLTAGTPLPAVAEVDYLRIWR